MSRAFPSVLLVAMPLFAACMQGPKPISDADKAAIRASNDKFTQLLLAKKWDGLAGMWTTNGTLMPPNQPIVSGRTAIQAWLAAFPPVSAFRLTSEEVDGAGDLAYQRGTYEITFTPPGAPGPMTDHGKWINAHHRNADGSWSIASDIWNSDMPMAAPPPEKPAAKAPAKHK